MNGWKRALCFASLVYVVGSTLAEENVEGQIARATGAALQGDAVKALKYVRSLPASGLSDKDKAFQECMLSRFASDMDQTSPKYPDKPFSRALLQDYRAYWRTALLDPGESSAAESVLVKALNKLAGTKGLDSETLEPKIEARLHEEGMHVLQGTTGRLKELMLWAKETRQERSVELPEGAFTVNVVYLDDFYSLGWGDFATCGRRGAGGWATPDALYAVVPRYQSLEGEEFRVTFLGHETQHFADLAKFPGIQPWELEYRAKLVELTQLQTTQARVLAKFLEDQGDDPASPHSYANRRVVQAVAARLGISDPKELRSVDTAKLNAAAQAELSEDTRQRRPDVDSR